MDKRRLYLMLIIAAAAVFISGSVTGRAAMTTRSNKETYERTASFVPAHCFTSHKVGNLVLGINNNGTFGGGFAEGSGDCFTGDRVMWCEYPKGSNSRYLFAAAFWIGAVVGRDTLVSVGADGWSYTREFFPDEEGFGDMIYRSIIDPSASGYDQAVSEEDYVAVYTDTVEEGVGPDYSGRPHIPLNLEVTQSSFAWSYSYAEDLVLFDYRVKNIGSQVLEKVYMGIYVDADIYFTGKGNIGAQDDLTGFVQTMEAQCKTCLYTDTVFIAWTSDNDGDLREAPPDGAPVPNVTATRIVRTPAKKLDVSFNWWISNANPSLDFGPREKPYKGRLKEDVRNFGTGGQGTPEGDANKYYMLRNQEFDYDQSFTGSILATDSLWLLPPQSYAGIWSRELDTRYLLSFGPFDINPGEVLPLSFAYLGGEGFHTVDGNLDNLPDHPDVFYSNLSFKDLGMNSRWASWIYDNPGVDTDGDGYFGEFFLCYNADSTDYDTCWTKGDGIPDFKGASPPPAPDFWLEPTVGTINVRFNGQRSETTPDVFSRQVDFEGYRIYVARDDRATSYSMTASYDVEDYNKWTRMGTGRWELLEEPFTLEELRCLYGDSCADGTFDPLDYTRSSPYVDPEYPNDSIFSFEKQDYNASALGITTPIRKRYPDQPYPSSLDPDSARPEELTEDGYLKYFEYEYEITDLLATVHYWINVTAFDFGSPQSGLPSLETSVTLGAQEGCPLAPWEEVHSKGLNVYVWPNPYRIDGEYRDGGFEGRGEGDRPDDRVRAVHFGNLPPQCTIRIYTLDGDLVREILHDADCVGPCGTTDHWNLITRNTQAAVSGLYYWTVEDNEGNVQIGKLMLIM